MPGSVSYIDVQLTAVTADNFTLNYLSNLGLSVTAGGLVMPRRADVVLPANATAAYILTEGVYFFPPGETVHSARTLQQRDEIIALTTITNATLAIYSYDAEFAVIRCEY